MIDKEHRNSEKIFKLKKFYSKHITYRPICLYRIKILRLFDESAKIEAKIDIMIYKIP